MQEKPKAGKATGRMYAIQQLAPADRDRAFAGILARSIPG
jgi:hypothetical protein